MSKLLKCAFRPRNYMGASFQAPHAAPGQRLMETHHSEHLNSHCFPFIPKSANMSVDMLDSLGITSWGFLQYLTQMGTDPTLPLTLTLFPLTLVNLFVIKNILKPSLASKVQIICLQF